MALNIKDSETVALAAEVAELTGESKTRAVKVALEERRARLRQRISPEARREALQRFLEEEIWPQIPAELRGQPPMTKEEREGILGYGPDGV
ncbi:MAG: type II toxin-antitoxin system VapB family antitoxin [Actinobacteria bacterium]|nr:type II toxin-antitoxin system VapB family antitoxin [Actinomycetota bacterium]